MTFNGKAIYDTGAFSEIAEDVSDLIGQISPWETPLLDALGQAQQSATNVLHEWLEDALNPNTIVSSSTLINSTNATALGVYATGLTAVANHLQVGAVLKNNTSGEYMQITAVNANTITVSRAFGSTSIASVGAGDELFIISDAALEGADVSGDISRTRSRPSNYCQIFKKDVIVSGTQQAVRHLGGVGNEYDYQLVQRTKESVRDLEKAVIQSKLSGNSIGSASAYRTMRGLWDFISTNATSTGTLNPTVVDNVIQNAWDQGATDTDIIVCDAAWKRVIDGFNDTRVEVMQGGGQENTYRRRISFYEGTFGTHRVVLSRWMPTTSMMVISSSRVQVLPLTGRSYQFIPVARTGDSEKGMVLGEYTLEVMNEEGMAKAYGNGIGV